MISIVGLLLFKIYLNDLFYLTECTNVEVMYRVCTLRLGPNFDCG